MVTAIVVVMGVTAAAQSPIPIRYRVTRAASGQASAQHVFLKSAMTCNVDPATALPNGSLAIIDPERVGRDCRISGTPIAPIFANMVVEIAYSYTVAGQANDIDPYGPESVPVSVVLPRIPQIPGAPGNPRIVPPGTPTIAVNGTVESRGNAFGLDVATTSLDGIPFFPFYFGAATLTSGDFAVRQGTQFRLQLWNP
jgi:hypothetical protein